MVCVVRPVISRFSPPHRTKQWSDTVYVLWTWLIASRSLYRCVRVGYLRLTWSSWFLWLTLSSSLCWAAVFLSLMSSTKPMRHQHRLLRVVIPDACVDGILPRSLRHHRSSSVGNEQSKHRHRPVLGKRCTSVTVAWCSSFWCACRFQRKAAMSIHRSSINTSQRCSDSMTIGEKWCASGGADRERNKPASTTVLVQTKARTLSAASGVYRCSRWPLHCCLETNLSNCSVDLDDEGEWSHEHLGEWLTSSNQSFVSLLFPPVGCFMPWIHNWKRISQMSINPLPVPTANHDWSSSTSRAVIKPRGWKKKHRSYGKGEMSWENDLRWFKSFLNRKTGVEHRVSIPTINPCEVARAKMSWEPVLKYFKSTGTPTSATSNSKW